MSYHFTESNSQQRIRQKIKRRKRNETENLKLLIKMYMQYTNIFFITGIIYLVLALLKKFNLNTAWYVVIGAAASIAAPFIYGIPVNVPVVGYIVKLLIGEADFVSFTPLYFLSRIRHYQSRYISQIIQILVNHHANAALGKICRLPMPAVNSSNSHNKNKNSRPGHRCERINPPANGILWR